MQGRIKRRQAEAAVQGPTFAPDFVQPPCPLCDRPIPASQLDAHHLTPKSRGGRETVAMHRICHRQIHALFTETELARELHRVDALKTHPDLARFIAWVRLRPDDCFERTRRNERLRKR